MQKFGKAVVDVNPNNVKAVVEVLKTGVLARAGAIAGGDLTFRNNNKRKVGTREQVISKGVESSTKVSGTGPMRWVEDGVDPHDIVPGAKRGASRGMLGSNLKGAEGPRVQASSLFSKGNYARAVHGAGVVLAFSNGMVRPYARGAGVLKGNKAWTTGVDAAEQLQGEIHGRGILRAGSSVF